MAGKGSAPGERRGGRAKGVPDKMTIATRERIQREADPIDFLMRVQRGEAIEASPTKEGGETVLVYQRMSAAQTLAGKITPDAKDTPISLDLPAIDSMVDAVKAMGVIADSVARGRNTPSEGQSLAVMIETYRKTYESAELEARIAALEEARQGH